MAARTGFRPAREIESHYVGNYPVSAGALPVLRGDAVIRNTTGAVTSMPAGMDPGAGWGVVLAVYTTANRPLTHQTAKAIVSAGVGRADVCWDPNMTYFVKCETSVGVADMNSRVNIDASATNTRLGTGISSQAVAIEASASVGNPFKIVGLSPFDELGGKGTGNASGQEIEVAWNNHKLRSGT